jgi:plasmid maintenance system antidote protein VapI
VPQRRIGEIVAGLRGVTTDTGLRLSRFFGVSDGFWIGLQMDFDAAIAKDRLSGTLAKIRPWADNEVLAQRKVSTDGLTAAPPRQARR